MTTPNPVQSIATSRASIGSLAARNIDLVFRQLLRGGGVERTGQFIRLISGEPHPLGNLAIIAQPDDLQATEEAMEPLLAGPFPSALLFPAGVSDSVARAVAEKGFEDAGPMPAMAADISRLPVTNMPPGYEWARIGQGLDGQAWAEALSVGYELPLKAAELFSPVTAGADMAADASIQFFSIKKAGRTVATSLLFTADGVAGIYCVATLPGERGRGLGAHATAEALRVAGQLGYRVGILQSSEAGHSVYLRLGFEDVGRVPMFIHKPG